MKKFVILFILMVLAIHQTYINRRVNRLPGWKILGDPVQNNFSVEQPAFQHQGASIIKIADYKIKARVLSTEHYWLGKMAQIAPIDVAVGWNEMSDTAIIEKLTISQADRFYFYSWKDRNSIDPKIAIRNSANMHLIPANDYVQKQIELLRIGHSVELTGQLVNVQLPESALIKSSTTRDDSGPGACEVMWVTNIQVSE